jgi:hypothetical protein
VVRNIRDQLEGWPSSLEEARLSGDGLGELGAPRDRLHVVWSAIRDTPWASLRSDQHRPKPLKLRHRLAIARALGQHVGPQSPGLGMIAALRGQGRQVAPGQVAIDPLVETAKLVRPVQAQDPPPALLGFLLKGMTYRLATELVCPRRLREARHFHSTAEVRPIVR